MMIIRLHTEMGSLYVLDPVAMTWARQRHVQGDEYETVEDGELQYWPVLTDGQHAVLNIKPEATSPQSRKRVICTPKVTSIEEVYAPNEPIGSNA